MWEHTNISRLRHAINAVLFIAILALGFSVFSLSATAQQSCGTHGDVVALLGKTYAESQVALGLSTNGVVIEVFSADQGTTWTILATRADGTTCVLSSGEQWIPVITRTGNPA